MATRKKSKTSDAIRDLDAWIGDDKGLRRAIAASAAHNAAAQLVHDARTSLGWTQAELARRVGTRQSVISRIEDADYHGHSLGLLQRIAFEMGLEVDIRFRKSRRRLGALPTSHVAESEGAKKATRRKASLRRERAMRKRGGAD
jgi:transcriptional regulator with XRE-family HTH domain